MTQKARNDDSTAPDWSDPPWGLLFPGLSKKRAKRILKLAEKEGISYGGEVTGPKWQLALGLDRITAQWLRAALSEEEETVVLNPSGTELERISPTEARLRMAVLVEELDEFLDYSDRYPIELS